MKWEEERWRKENEMEERRRREEREHELQVLETLGRMMRPSYPPHTQYYCDSGSEFDPFNTH